MHTQDRRTLAVGVIGAGRLGSALAAGLVTSGYRVAVASRSHERAGALASGLAIDAVAPERLVEHSDIVFLAVPDGAIRDVAAGLSWRRGQAAVHCSGALGLDALQAAANSGAATGCLHPLQSFPADTAPREAPGLFRGITCGVEGTGPLGRVLDGIVVDLGGRTIRLDGVDRALYHAAAVLVSNDVIALASAATRVWALAGLPAADARSALAPLLRAAAGNVGALPLERALTGPVARGDVATVERHLQALEMAPELRDLYRRLALELLRLELGHPAGLADELRSVLTPE